MSSAEQLQIRPLGAGREVGRSCILIEFKRKKILLDCGIHPGLKGNDALPKFNLIDASSINLVLITHFHLDHSAALPYFTEKTSFSGSVYMTRPTKSVMKMVLKDYLRVSTTDEHTLYTADDIAHCCSKIESLDFMQEKELMIDNEGIKFTAYPAGHVLGAAMFLIEIDGTRILYTGDYSTHPDHHLSGAIPPSKRTDIVIVESTFGTQEHPPPQEREAEFTGMVSEIVMRGGYCLIPTFALGRAQELLLILDAFWASHPHLQSIPIYYASQIVNQSLAIYKASIDMMNSEMQELRQERNPFQFRFISTLNENDFECAPPCVVLASPAMLESGLSRELFDKWCSNEKNGVVMTGYSVEGTFGKKLRTNPTTVHALNGGTLEVKCSIKERVDPYHVVLVHGERKQANNLCEALRTMFSQRISIGRLTLATPENGETLNYRFSSQRRVKIVGKLSYMYAEDPQTPLPGILVYKNYSYLMVHPDDLRQYTKLSTSQISLKQSLPYHHELSLLTFLFRTFFSDVQQLSENTLLIEGKIRLSLDKAMNKLTIEWNSTPIVDLIADTVLALILQGEGSPATLSITMGESSKVDPLQTYIESIVKLLKAQYGNCTYNQEEQRYDINEGEFSIDLNKKVVLGVFAEGAARLPAPAEHRVRALHAPQWLPGTAPAPHAALTVRCAHPRGFVLVLAPFAYSVLCVPLKARPRPCRTETHLPRGNPLVRIRETNPPAPMASPKHPPILFRTSFKTVILDALSTRPGWCEGNESHWNLQWVDKTWMKDGAERLKLSENQRINHFFNFYELTRKDLLIKHVNRTRIQLRRSSAKNVDFDLCPRSFVLPSEHSMFVEEYKKVKGVWIMKPIGRSQGKGIFLITKASEISEWGRDGKYSSALGNDTYLVQKYIENPYCLGGKKFDLRIYCLVMSYTPLNVWLYRQYPPCADSVLRPAPSSLPPPPPRPRPCPRDGACTGTGASGGDSTGFCRFTNQRFSAATKDIENVLMHLTNVAIQKQSEDYDGRCKMTLHSLRLYMESKHGRTQADLLFSAIQTIILRSLFCTQSTMIQDRHCFELYGYDILIDSELHPWILEVNASPSMSASSPEDYQLKMELLNDVLDVVDLEGVRDGTETQVGQFDLIWSNNNPVLPKLDDTEHYITYLGCRPPNPPPFDEVRDRP